MLEEYVALRIEDGGLCSLPQLVDGYVPPMLALPLFVWRLATQVDWLSPHPHPHPHPHPNPGPSPNPNPNPNPNPDPDPNPNPNPKPSQVDWSQEQPCFEGITR